MHYNSEPDYGGPMVDPTTNPDPRAAETGGLKAKWGQLDLPVKIGVVVASLIVFGLVARYVLPVLIAAVGIGLVIALLFVPYWIPTIVAFFRKHPSKAAILVVNMFFGWTFIGWFVALVWALTDSVAGGGQTVVVNTVVQNTNNNVANAGAPPQGFVAAPQQAPSYQVGDVVNGHRFDGVNWTPVAPQAPLPPAAAQVGDVVNGHRFDGAAWVPVATPTPPAPASHVPQAGDELNGYRFNGSQWEPIVR